MAIEAVNVKAIIKRTGNSKNFLMVLLALIQSAVFESYFFIGGNGLWDKAASLEAQDVEEFAEEGEPNVPESNTRV